MIIAIDYSRAIARSFVSSKVSETNAEYGWQVYTEERVASLSKLGSGDGHPAASAPESGQRPLNGGRMRTWFRDRGRSAVGTVATVGG